MVLWVGVKGIPYGFMGGSKRYTLWFYGWVKDTYLMVLWVDVRGIFYFLWVGVRDIPYGFMGGSKRYILWFYGGGG